jgi:1-acyl-sn-glycerol-3-phosphate acyltransferase
MRQMNVMTSMLASTPEGPESSEGPLDSASWKLGPNVPQSPGTLLRRFGHAMLRMLGWRLVGQMPNLPRFIVIIAPHTSNLDFLILLFAKWALGIQVRFIGKNTLFYPPLGWFMRAIGGVPVIRTQKNNLVSQSIHEFATREQFVLALAPEGTRKRVVEWKSGFWHIAREARVPICCVGLDYSRKRVKLGPVLEATGDDAVRGVAEVRAHFVDVVGRHPSQQ